LAAPTIGLASPASFQLQARLVSSAVRAGSSFGDAVALSAHGDTALVGASNYNKGGGAAWVFVRSGSGWAEQGALLKGVGEVGQGGFGNAVALSANGNTALVGGEYDNFDDTMLTGGAVWVFVRSGSKWAQQGPKLTVDDGQDFGSSVALSADGNTAVIGERNYGNSGEFGGEGAAWVFVRSGSTWVPEGGRISLNAGAAMDPGGSWDFGAAVALSAGGGTILIGSPYEGDVGGAFDSNGDGGIGAAYVFTRAGSQWRDQSGSLFGNEASVSPSYSYDQPDFGASVALSADGNTALIGGNSDNSGAGAVWTFTRSGAKWAQQGPKLVVPGAHNLGSTVALSADGTTALVGGNGRGGTAEAWLFTRSGAVWAQQGAGLTLAGPGAVPASVALSSRGAAAVVGGNGRAWAFGIHRR
jgi:hypothetical protein